MILPDTFVHNECERAEARAEVDTEREDAVGAAEGQGVLEVGVDEAGTGRDAGRLEGGEEHARKEDLQEGVAEVGRGSCKVPEECTEEEEPLA